MKLYKQIKSLIPNRFKYPGWYLFKAPQRKISWRTLYFDLIGLAIYALSMLDAKKQLQPVSICTGIKNRSANYLNHLLESLTNIEHPELIELSVFDCGSDDISNFELRIKQKWKGKLIFRSEEVPFARSYSFNKAVDQASSPIVFICDADMSLPQNLVKRCNQFTGPKRVWYPIYFFLYPDKPASIHPNNGTWEQYGSKGMFACLKRSYQQIGGLNERFTVWGHEDTELWERFHANGYIVIRNRQSDFFHHWHKSHNPKYMHLNESI